MKKSILNTLESISLHNLYYEVKIKTSESSHAGTDDSVYAIIFGDKKSTKKIRLNNSGDDFEGGWNTFKVLAARQDVGDIGTPYAINLEIEGSDGWKFLNVEVRRFYENSETDMMSIARIIAFGEKGEFGLGKDTYAALLFASEPSVTTNSPTNMIVGDYYHFVDLRGLERDTDGDNTIKSDPIMIEKSLTIQDMEKITRSLSNTSSIKLSGSIGGGWFSAGTSWEISTSFTAAKTVTNETLKKKVISIKENISDFRPEKGKINMWHRQYVIRLNSEHTTIGKANFDIYQIPNTFLPEMKTTISTYNDVSEMPVSVRNAFNDGTSEDLTII